MKKKKGGVKWWTSEEVEALKDGVEKHGRDYVSILNDPQFASSLANRSRLQIKDKWWSLNVRQDYVMCSPSKSSKKAVVESNSKDKNVKWTSDEVEALIDGVEKHGRNYASILNDPQFASSLANRSRLQIKDKWWRLSVRRMRSCDVLYTKKKVSQDYVMRSPSESSKKAVVESNSEDKNVKWTSEEVEVLIDGVEKHGRNYVSILNDPQFASSLANPSRLQIKGKWRRLSVGRMRSCDVLHTKKKVGQANMMRSPSKSSRKAVIESNSEDHHTPCTTRKRRTSSIIEEASKPRVHFHIIGTRRNRIKQGNMLDSKEVHNYLEKIWVSFPEDRKSSFTHLDPLWYTLYSDDSNKEKVLNWIRKKDIFSKSYVIFPIILWGHWSVLIFCHFGESIGSKFKTPCIVLLDSLAKADHSLQLEPMIRRFVLDIYKNAQRTEDIRLLRKMPFLVPKVPQQRDGDECGFFVLYYIKLFVENAPESFSISDGYPYFMKKDWFSYEGLDSFFRTLDTSHDSF